MDGFGLVAGMVLAVCGAANVLGVAIEVVPLVCIALGVVLLGSTWTAHRGPRGGPGGTDLHAHSHPRT